MSHYYSIYYQQSLTIVDRQPCLVSQVPWGAMCRANRWRPSQKKPLAMTNPAFLISLDLCPGPPHRWQPSRANLGPRCVSVGMDPCNSDSEPSISEKEMDIANKKPTRTMHNADLLDLLPWFAPCIPELMLSVHKQSRPFGGQPGLSSLGTGTTIFGQLHFVPCSSLKSSKTCFFTGNHHEQPSRAIENLGNHLGGTQLWRAPRPLSSLGAGF